MAANLERLAQDFAKGGYHDVANGLRKDANRFRSAGGPEELPTNTPSRQDAPGSRVARIITEYKTGPNIPEILTATFQQIWEIRAAQVADLLGKPLAPVAPVDRTKEEIARLEKEGRMLGYVPPELATQEKRHILGAMFPKMQSHSVQRGNSVTNEVARSGWFDYEAAIDGPYPNLTEDGLKRTLAQKGRPGMNATEYVIAGQDSKAFTGKYLDQDITWSRLPGSRLEGRVVGAGFYPGGRLFVRSFLGPGLHIPGLRGRSVGVK